MSVIPGIFRECLENRTFTRPIGSGYSNILYVFMINCSRYLLTVLYDWLPLSVITSGVKGVIVIFSAVSATFFLKHILAKF